MSILPKKEFKEFSDEKLVELILLAGNSSFFGEIYDRYALKIFQKCVSFTKNEQEAKDVAHDVIIKIYLKLSSFNKKSKFSSWVYAVTYNYCVDHQTKSKKQMSFKDEIKLKKVEYDAHPSDAEVLSISVETLHMLLEKLTPAEKSLLLMKYQDEFSIKEICELTGAGESAVKMKLKRTKAKLMTLYEKGK